MAENPSEGMPYCDFLNAIIDDGEMEARTAYAAPDQRDRLDGALLGFAECRGKSPPELEILHEEARGRSLRAKTEQDPRFWYWRDRDLQIEWVMNVLGAALLSHGLPVVGDVQPTLRGIQKAGSILGLAPHDLFKK